MKINGSSNALFFIYLHFNSLKMQDRRLLGVSSGHMSKRLNIFLSILCALHVEWTKFFFLLSCSFIWLINWLIEIGESGEHKIDEWFQVQNCSKEKFWWWKYSCKCICLKKTQSLTQCVSEQFWRICDSKMIVNKKSFIAPWISLSSSKWRKNPIYNVFRSDAIFIYYFFLAKMCSQQQQSVYPFYSGGKTS